MLHGYEQAVELRNPQIVFFVHRKWHTDAIYEVDLVKAQEMGLTFHQTFKLCCCSFWRRSSRINRKSRWTRWNDLVRETIRSRTARTVGWPTA